MESYDSDFDTLKMELQDLGFENLQNELSKRFIFQDKTKENQYIKEEMELRISRPYDTHASAGNVPADGYNNRMEELQKRKLREIRIHLNEEDSVFEKKIKSILGGLIALKEKLMNDLNNPEIKKPVYPSRLSAFTLLFTGKEPDDPDKKTKEINKKIDSLRRIIKDIETLKHIYTHTHEPTEEQKTGGAKKKTRRNRNNNKSRKNLRKSKCRYCFNSLKTR